MKNNKAVGQDELANPQHYQAIVRHLTEGIVIVDENLQIIEWNMAMEAITGAKAGDILGRRYVDVIMEFVPPEVYSTERKERMTAITKKLLMDGNCEGADNNHDIEILRRDGSRKYIRQSVFTIPVGDKFHVGSVSVDVTRRKAWEAVLRQREIRYRALFETANDGILMLNSDLIIECNQKALALFGCTREEIIGKSPVDFSPDFQPDGASSKVKALDFIQNTLADQPQFFLWKHKQMDGTLFDAEISLNAVELDHEKYIQAIVRDVTTRLEEHAQLQKYTAELRELNIAKDKFFSIIAHDLKSPFNAIMGFSDVLTTDWKSFTEEERQHFIGNINASAKNTYRLLENLLEWAMAQTGRLVYEPSPVDLSILANDVVITMRDHAEKKRIRLFSSVNFGTMVNADQNMVRTILRNLISNAIKFSESGGQVKVFCDLRGDGLSAPKMVEVCIVDNGIGIDPAVLPSLFRIGEKVKSSGTAQERGTGLGLILCRELVEKNGGTICAESVPGKGSRFCFTLPAVF